MKLIMFKRIISQALPALLLLSCGQTLAAEHQVSGKITLLDMDGKAKSYHGKTVVFLEPKSSQQLASKVGEEIVISQRGRRFRPSVLPVIKGTAVAFPNDDKVLHNVFSLSKNEPFDLGNYKKGESRSVVFDQPGLTKVYCNIHPKMQLDVLVLNAPYFDTTDKDGNYKIENVPEGDYQLRVWQELSASITKEIKVGSSTVSQDFELTQTTARAKHKNKHGKAYKGKY